MCAAMPLRMYDPAAPTMPRLRSPAHFAYRHLHKEKCIAASIVPPAVDERGVRISAWL